MAATMLATVVTLLAALVRPNALDREVDQIAVAQLLTQPAAALVDHARQLAAVRLEHWLLPGWFIGLGAQLVVLAYVWQSGSAARIRDLLRARFGHEGVVRFLFGASLALIARLASLLPDLYTFRIERVMGLSVQLLRSWSSEWLLNTLLAMIVVGIVVAAVLWLVDRTHQWYVYTILAILTISFAINLIAPFVPAPFLGAYRALPPSLAAPMQTLKNAAGNPNVPIVVREHTYSYIGTSGIQGLGPTLRIIISDPLIAASSLAELRYAVAYELGFISLGAPWKLALYDAFFVILGAALAVGIADRIRFRIDDDPVSRLTLVASLLVCVYIIAAPIYNGILQRYSVEADAYAIALTHDRAPAVRAIVRASDQDMDEVCPELGARWFMESTADASTRISAITGTPRVCP
jgi:STE24 endopeptidase